MTTNLSSDHRVDPEIYEPAERQDSPWGLSRRDFVQVLGAGLLITVTGEIALAQRRGGAGEAARRVRRTRPGERRRQTAHRSRRRDHRHDGQGRGGARLPSGTHPGRRGRIAAGPGPHPADHGRHRPGARRRHDRRQRQHAQDGPLDPQRGGRRPRAAARTWPPSAGRSIGRRCGSATAPSRTRRRNARSPTPNWPKRKTLPRRSPGRSPATSR